MEKEYDNNNTNINNHSDTEENEDILKIINPLTNKKIVIIKQYFNNRDFNLGIPSNSDLVSGKYEGGIKLWECSIDLLEFLPVYLRINFIDNKKITSFYNLNCLELGCGHGLPGIYSLCLGMKVLFQDYNQEVLDRITKTYVDDIKSNNTYLNKQYEINEDYFFIDGDWSKMKDQINNKKEYNNIRNKKFDLILSADTLYNVEYYDVFHNTIKDFIQEDGVCLIASKLFYFGVGGGTDKFEEFCKEKNVFDCKEVLRIRNGFSNIRVILELKLKK